MIFRCASCKRYFSIDYGQAITDQEILVRHLEGTPIRKLSTQLQFSKSKIQRILKTSLDRVPNSNHITEIVCKHFSGVLQIDGKYLSVKGHERKIPLIWCIDYWTHDVLIYVVLSYSENYQAYLDVFRQLKQLNYPLSTVVCDEHEAIRMAARHYYSKVKIQLCVNHYKENVRRQLNSRSTPEHTHFVKQIEYLFRRTSVYEYSKYARKLVREHGENSLYRGILHDLNFKHEILIRYLVDNKVPATNNLIEVFNSHLEARVRALKGFESYKSANLWLNAYILNRRLTKFTDCGKKFKHINGKCSLALTAMYDAPKVKLLKKVRKF